MTALTFDLSPTTTRFIYFVGVFLFLCRQSWCPSDGLSVHSQQTHELDSFTARPGQTVWKDLKQSELNVGTNKKFRTLTYCLHVVSSILGVELACCFSQSSYKFLFFLFVLPLRCFYVSAEIEFWALTVNVESSTTALFLPVCVFFLQQLLDVIMLVKVKYQSTKSKWNQPFKIHARGVENVLSLPHLNSSAACLGVSCYLRGVASFGSYFVSDTSS